MGDRISTALELIDDRLADLHALLTDEPIEVVTGRYLAWKSATTAALAGILDESAVRRFDQARGTADPREGRRPTPPVYLDGAASRASLMAIKRDLEQDPAAVLRGPAGENTVDHPPGGVLKIVSLLTRRLPTAFRGRPETELDLRNGFETLLAGADIAYECGGGSGAGSGGSFFPDFTFPEVQAALKLKLCDGPNRDRQIAAEITREISAGRASFRHLLFGLYDLGFIREPERFCGAFAAHEGVWVGIIKS